MAKASAGKPTPVEKKLFGVADTVIAAADRSRDPAQANAVRSLANATNGMLHVRFEHIHG